MMVGRLISKANTVLSVKKIAKQRDKALRQRNEARKQQKITLLQLNKTKKHRNTLIKEFRAVKTISADPYKIQNIEKNCPFCANETVSYISNYPGHQTPFFAKRLVAWCEKCGGGFVFNLEISLDEYYKNIYAVENRQNDRSQRPEQYFSDSNKLWDSKKGKKYLNRVNLHIELLNEFSENYKSILDFGSGPGYLLWKSKAKKKYGLEPDVNSKKYLDYLGATIVGLDSLPKNVDCIVASHSLEHLEFNKLNTTIDKIKKSLSRKGVLLVEVPPGALLQKRYEYLHEPHTLFYSKKSMIELMKRHSFELLHFYTYPAEEINLVEPEIIAAEEQIEINASMIFLFKKKL